MNSISVKCNIHDVELNSAHVLSAKDSFFGSPLESRLHGITDFIKVLYTSGLVTEHVWSTCLGSEAPELTSVIHVPSVFVYEDLSACFGFLSWSDVFVFNSTA